MIVWNNLVDCFADRWEEPTISTHLRIAASVCALSTGLLIGSPAAAIAAADTGSGSDPGGSNSASEGAGGPVGSIADSLRKSVQDTLEGVTGTLSSLAKPGQQQASNLKPPKMIFGGTPTVHGSTGSGSSAVQAISDAAAPIASEPSVVAPAASAPIPSTTPAASVPTPVPAAPDIVVPVSNVIATVAGSVASAPALLVSLPTSATPVSDVLSSLQDMLTSVANASIPLTQLPSDLSALLGVGTVIPQPTTAAGTDRVEPSAATDALTLQAPGTGAPLPLLNGFGAVVPGAVTAPATPLDITTAGTGGGVASSASVLAPKGDESSALSIVQHVIGAFVATVSLTALAAMALPGIVGLLGTCAAGIRIGYRQAKAGSALHATAIARFVGSGPVGVVRSASQVSLRPRVVRPGSPDALATHAVGPRALSSVHLLDLAG